MEDYGKLPSPCYVLEERLLRRNLSLIKHVADEAGVEIILAFKAYALWKTFPIFREYISHTTASSVSEARLAFEEFGSKAHTYSPAYTDEDFPTIVKCSSHITFNSLSQYARFGQQAQESGVSCGLRVNPEYSEIETEIYNPCAPGSRFGILSCDLPEELPAGIEGFHCHCHCESSAEALEHTLVHLEDKFGKWFKQIKWLNLGGGHLMTRKDYEVDRLIGILKGLRERYPWLKIVLEPGSAFGWQTGPLISRVVDVVENHGIRTAILNVSFACHMPDCLEMPYWPTVRGAETMEDETSTEENVYRLGGNSCLSGDFMSSWRFDHELKPGDYVVLEDMLHYTTVKTNTFNGISHPAIALRRLDGKIELLREYGYEDYKSRMD
ncbi:MAG: carboxynorspermidine decarboxylase [Bacteroidales bacterium]|nr:carboxynorspermidine decarboxylase [Candidatus Liminaster caballi]